MTTLKKFCVVLLLPVLLTGISISSAYAQSQEDKDLAQQLIDIAEEIMNNTRAMDQARDNYVQAAILDPSNVMANYKAGEYHILTVDKDQAAQYFEKVKELDPSYRFNIDYSIGTSYQYGMNFEKAIEYYELYLQKLKSSPNYRGSDITAEQEVMARIDQCKNAIDFRADPVVVQIRNIGGTVNSEFDDFAPVLDGGEEFLVFTTRRRDENLNENVDEDNKPFEDIFYAKKDGNRWGYASNIGRSINTRTHDSNLALSADGNTLFIYKVQNNGDIYVTTKVEDTVWTQPESIGEYVNSSGFKESSVSPSPDGQTIYFSSNRPGGNGGSDIYYSTLRDDGEWDRPRNLGDKINTPGSEDGPWIDYDGKTLYFSSEGHKGMGGYDIFRTVYDSATQEWSDPENIGYPINTPDDDIYFVGTKDGKRGYYASVREDGYGFLDIYEISFEEVIDEPEIEDTPIVELPQDPVDTTAVEAPQMQPVTVTVSVKNEGGEPLDATVSFKNAETGQIAGMRKDGPGVFVFTLQNESSSNYSLSVENRGYLFESRDIRVPAMSETAQQITRAITMRKPVVNTRKILRNIYFDFNKASFKQQSFEELNRLYQMMSENANMRIEISGHTDNIGGASYNKQLSQRRANAVKNFLIEKGVDARRIDAIGYGEERPLASNDDEKEGREFNRRVEFKVLQ